MGGSRLDYHITSLVVGKVETMDFWTFVNSWYFIGILVALLVILVGVFIFLRMRKRED